MHGKYVTANTVFPLANTTHMVRVAFCLQKSVCKVRVVNSYHVTW